MKKIKGILPLLICAALLTSCDSKPEPAAAQTTAAPSAPETTVTTTAPVTIAAALDGEDETKTAPVKEEKPLVIAVDGVASTYSPLVREDSFGELVRKACFTTLLGKTRSGASVLSGVTGESELFGGRKYDYEGIADASAEYDEENGTTAYSFSLRTDVKFADGEVLDADDVIFTLYAALDPGADSLLKNAGIVGAANYWFNSPIAEELTAEQISEALASEEMIPIIREKVIIPVLEEQYVNVESLYSDDSHDIYTATYPDPLDLFVFFFSTDKSYEVTDGAEKDKVIADVAEGYGADYRRLAGITVGDGSAFDNAANAAAVCYLTEKAAAESEEVTNEPVNSITGIQKTGKYSLRITVRGNGVGLEDALCALPILPLHYYGDEKKYDYAADKFGFERGSAAALTEVHSGEPMGSGAYTFAGTEDGALLLKANEYFFLGTPKTQNIKLIPAGDPAALISGGSADMTMTLGSAELSEKIEAENKSIEKIHTGVVSGAGYGFAAFDVNVVNVAGAPYSEESCALRTAIALAVSYFRGSSAKEYFGSEAEAAILPRIGNIAIDTAAEDFTVPYTTDVKGKPIYAEGMTESERRAAMKEACLGFFGKAGYTVEDGKITAAPEGGKLVFSAEFTSAGTGSHPAKFALEKAAKLLSGIGITLNITDVPDAGMYMEDIMAGTVGIGVFSFSGNLRQKFAGELTSTLAGELSELIEAAESAPSADLRDAYMALYKKMIYEYAAEIPLYERTEDVLYSALRIDRTTLTKDMTESYGQQDELYKIKMK